jgi:uncharacterized membrane protein YoaK (UPF0700 family)
MVLHPLDRVVSLRHLPSWALLAFAAGAVNAGALAACERFVSHITGTVTLVGADAGKVLALDYLLVLACFFIGAGAAVVLVRRFPSKDQLPYWLPLSVVALTVSAVALLGHAGVFGTFGGAVETTQDFVLLCVLSFAMGMQNSAVAVSTGMAVRTTHMTGPATDFAVGVATLFVGSADERPQAIKSIALRGTKLVAFVLGAAVMIPLCSRLGFLAFMLPAVTCAVATLSSFLPVRIAVLSRDEGVRT